MRKLSLSITIAAGALLFGGSASQAQDNSALVDLLLRKGVLTDQEAEDLRADLAKENAAALVSTSKTPNLSKLNLSGRFQAQFVSLDTSIHGPTADPAHVNHSFLRRIYVGVKPVFSNGWSAFLNYDFAGSTFDAAYMEKIFSPKITLQAGFKKAPIGLEEYFVSSGALKSIERSAATRFFVEGNNGRRLGAGSYRQGVWLLGREGDWSYEIAVTNPEREESSSGAAGVGNSANNGFAFWGNLNYSRAFAENRGLAKFGTSVGFLPDQGGKTLGVGDDLTVWSLYADLRYGNWSLLGEYLGSKNEHGVSATQDSASAGFYLQASYRHGAYEPVVRYTFVDSDGRGIQSSDGIRSSASGGTMNELSEIYAGGNWYIVGNEAKHEVKLQAGYIFGETRDSISGASGPKAYVQGLRTQLQVNF